MRSPWSTNNQRTSDSGRGTNRGMNCADAKRRDGMAFATPPVPRWRGTRTWVRIAHPTLITVLLLLVSVPSFAAPQFSLVVKGARVHGQAHGADLVEVLEALAGKAGLSIVWDGPPPLANVALQWRGVSVEDAVHDLLRNEDHLLVYGSTRSGKSVLVEVWVFGQPLTELGDEKLTATKQPPDQGTITAAMRELIQLTAELRQQKNVAQLTRVLSERIHDPDRQIQRFVLSAFAESPDPRATEILTSVVRDDPNPVLRSLAASALLDRGGIESVATLTRAVSEDPDPAVRRALLKTLGRVG